MALKRTLQIKYKDTADNTFTHTISSHANPTASDYVMRQTAAKLNDLTDNTLIAIYTIDTNDITSAQPS